MIRNKQQNEAKIIFLPCFCLELTIIHKLTAGMQHHNACCISYAITLNNLIQVLYNHRLQLHAITAIETNQVQALHGYFGTHHKTRTEYSAKAPFHSLRVGFRMTLELVWNLTIK